MRIALVVLAPGTGGVTRNAFDLAGGLAERGHDVEIFGRADAASVRQAAQSLGFEWRPLSAAASATADVWHLHAHNTLDLRVMPLLAARKLFALLHRRGDHGRSRLIMTEHLPRVPRTDFVVPSNLPRGGRWSWRKPGARQIKTAMKKLELNLCDSVITVCSRGSGFLAARYGVAEAKLVTIPPGVVAPGDAPAPMEHDGPMRVLAIGELHWRKGFDLLIEACGLARERWSVDVVGDGVARDELVCQAESLRSDREIRFVGHRHDGASAPLQADVVCVPSRCEGLPYVVLEGMAAARPIVATDGVDGASDAVSDGEHGLMVPGEDPRRLAMALDRMARDRQQRIRMGLAAHARARTSFSLDQMVNATLDAYTARS